MSRSATVEYETFITLDDGLTFEPADLPFYNINEAAVYDDLMVLTIYDSDTREMNVHVREGTDGEWRIEPQWPAGRPTFVENFAFVPPVRFELDAYRFVEMDMGEDIDSSLLYFQPSPMGYLLYSHSETGLWGSSDLGDSWSRMSDITPEFISVNEASHAAVCDDKTGVNVYTDGHWRSIGPALNGDCVDAYVLPDSRFVAVWGEAGSDRRFLYVTREQVAVSALPEGAQLKQSTFSRPSKTSEPSSITSSYFSFASFRLSEPFSVIKS